MQIALVSIAWLLLFIPVIVQAEEEAPCVSGEAGVSYVATSGNTSNSTIGLSAEMAWQPRDYKVNMQIGFVTTENDHQVISRRLDAALRSERRILQHLSAYVQGSYYRDVFSGVRSRTTIDAGGLSNLIASDRTSFGVFGSLVQTWDDRVNADNRTFLGGRVGFELHAKPSDSVSWDYQASYIRDFSDADNWRVQSSAALTSALSRIFAIKISHQLYYANAPEPGKKTTDTTTLVSLVVSWPHRR